MHALEATAAAAPGVAAPEDAIVRAAGALRAQFGAGQVRILVHDLANASLVFEAVSGGPARLVGMRVPAGTGITWWALEHGMLYVPDCAADDRFCAAVDAPLAGEAHSIVAARFGYQGRALGVVLLVNLPAAKALALSGGDPEPMFGTALGFLGATYAAAALQAELRQTSAANARLTALVEKRSNRLREALTRLKTQDR